MWDVLYVFGKPWRLLQATGEHVNTGCFVSNQVHLVPLGICLPTECQCLVEAPRQILATVAAPRGQMWNLDEQAVM